MRIVLIGPTHPYRGGISQHTSLLATELKKQHTLKFISFSRQYPKILFPGKSDKDPDSPPLFHGKVDYLLDSVNPLTLIKTIREIVQFKPDHLIIPWWVTYWAPHDFLITRIVKILTKTKVTFLCHNVIEHESSWLKKFLTKLVLAGGDKLVTQSQSETDKIKSLLKNNSVETAFHPTYADLKTGKEITKSEAQKQLNIDDNAILFFGFVRQYKGLDILLDAMPKILDRNSTLILLVVGEFWKNKADYLEQIERLKLSENIRLFDEYIPNEELSLYFTAADLVVQPYRSVTGSGVCQLSYGLDTPVIATDLGSLKDVITDKENGRLVPPENPDALADAIIESLEAGNLAKMTKAAVDTKKRYSWERFVQILTGQNE